MTGSLHLSALPGLHFDEAWAAQFAARIAEDPLFFPIHAMSPQTAPWGHYFTAAWFSVFGKSLFVYRMSCLGLSGLGLVFGMMALLQRNLKRGAALLPWLAASFPAWVLNHRFAIELTSVHTFCFGLILLAISLKESRKIWRGPLAALGLFIGITSHALFVALPLAWILWHLTTERPSPQRQDRFWGAGLGLAILPFFYKIYLGTPWKTKALALIAADLIFIGFLCFGESTALVWARQKLRPLKWIYVVLAVVFGFNFLVFSEGSWSLLTQTGHLSSPYWLMGAMPLLIFQFLRADQRWKSIPQTWLQGAVALIIATSLVLVVPAPRYFETSFFLAIFILSAALSSCDRKQALGFCTLFGIIGWTQLSSGFWSTATQSHPQYLIKDFRLLLLHESSRDFAPKNNLILMVHSQGCRINQIKISDERLRGTFSTLETLLASQPKTTDCPSGLLLGWKDREHLKATDELLFQSESFIVAKDSNRP